MAARSEGIDTTSRVAFEYGYSIIIPQAGTTTFDNGKSKANELLEYYQQRVCDKRFASIMQIEEIVNKMYSKNQLKLLN